jgi:hypothetical protein
MLRSLPSSELGRLSQPLMPGVLAGMAGSHTLALMRGIREVLTEREIAA